MSSFQEIAYFDGSECLRFVNKLHPEGFSQSVGERASPTLKEVLGSEEYAKRKPHIEAAFAGQRVAFERRMSAALHDPLTGLPNRHLLADRVSLAIAQARRNTCASAVVYLDLDGFKEVNDTLGHDAADRLLEMVGQRLVAAVREVDTVARVGGDEFAVVLWQVNGAFDAASVASKLLKTVSKQYGVRGRTVKITVSAGVAIYPAHGDDAATLLKSADLALHQAKHSGKNAYRVFDGETLLQRRGHLAAVRPFARTP